MTTLKDRGKKAAAAEAATDAPAEIASGRDIRVDRIGYCQELVKLWADPMKDAVKAKMIKDGLGLALGDRYEGKLAQPAGASPINPIKFYRLFKKGEISEKDFLSAIQVSKDSAKAFMSPREMEAISDQGLPGSPRLSIVRRKGIDIPLAAAIAGIVEANSVNVVSVEAGVAAGADAAAA